MEQHLPVLQSDVVTKYKAAADIANGAVTSCVLDMHAKWQHQTCCCQPNLQSQVCVACM